MRRTFMVATTAVALALAACGDLPVQPEPGRPVEARAPTMSPAAAAAQSVLAVSSLQCYDVGGGGYAYNITNCWASASGGTPGYTFTWDVIVNYQNSNGSYIEGVCTDSYPVTVTVRDAAGATATQSATFVCYAKSTGGGLEP